MPEYPHICEECEHEWDEFYSIHDPIPEVCPNCGAKAVKRLIGGHCGGVVELTGNEFKDKVKEDVIKMKHRIKTDENYAANFYGETKYEQTKKHNESVRKEANYIKRQFRRVK